MLSAMASPKGYPHFGVEGVSMLTRSGQGHYIC